MLLLTPPTLQITLILQSVMPKPVYLLTVQEAHKKYNSLTYQIRAKYKQLDSGKYGAIGTSAFNAEASELANLLACVSQLCQKLNLPPPKKLYRPMFFKHFILMMWVPGRRIRLYIYRSMHFDLILE